MPRARIFDLSPETHRPHPLHGGQRNWVESNCYLDLWVEVLHALELEPLACFGFTLASDFEGDQWTFSKPSNLDLVTLYGLSVEELTVWRNLQEHCLCHLELGHLPLLEVDAYYLPDVAQTDYRANHVKTTVGVCAIDTEAQQIEYLHNSGYFRLEGADYRGLFRLDRAEGDIHLPPYCEIVKMHRRVRLTDDELHTIAYRQSGLHLARGPDENPMQRFAAAFEPQMRRVVGVGESAYHHYAFASLRQMGAAAEYAALHLRWLAHACDERHAREPALILAAGALEEISEIAKVLLMKTARMVARGSVSDVSSQLGTLTDSWLRARDALQEYFAS